MADDIDYEIIGNDMQLVEIELDPGETVQAEAGAMAYMGPGIQMQTGMGNEGGGLLGGLKKGLKRALTGESFFITSFTHKGSGKGHVAFAAPYPGKILPLDLAKFGGSILCQKDAFLCAAKGVEVELAFTRKIGAGLFGGEGFILQRLRGNGLAFVHIGGTVIKKDLAPGETYHVDTGCVAAFTETVSYDITWSKDFKNALFGGEGVVLATLTGPGTVYMQSLPFSRLADRIAAASSYGRGRDEQTGIGGSGVLGGLLGGDRSF
ncbi:MAG: TIGR00266 family protein [Methanosarcina sp.]|uniref:TIGR00266 family protein n=1 Tax=Methanosarcina sp. TaxID=2213 RepID=UPI0026338CD3|nr:TIGR00266 family protein [Methanosarcina sp.]MDD3247551.1 TIGR00266 family protein [Methanosarcina sp.]